MRRTTIYLARHGQTQWNVERRAQGHLDSPLTEMGVRQATWLRDALIDIYFDVIYSSSSLRAYRTAEILRAHRTCELVPRDDLREIHLGSWEGKTSSEIRKTHSASHIAYRETPHLYQPENGGESFHDVQKRVTQVFNELVTQHEGGTLLVVSHASALKTLLCHLEHGSLEQLWETPFMHPTALSKVVVEDGQFSIELYGDISHYPEEERLRVQ
ncbi:MAG: histidine phosphatase family protein [Ktedonobacteraceae bacterium]|nr:histidine phosphatase family protein [Ktedonobacteraceae bacterium]MBO0790499.1 histidine phosphatase family protein [Ktedonobacteraceae bacterium]